MSTFSTMFISSDNKINVINTFPPTSLSDDYAANDFENKVTKEEIAHFATMFSTLFNHYTFI